MVATVSARVIVEHAPITAVLLSGFELLRPPKAAVIHLRLIMWRSMALSLVLLSGLVGCQDPRVDQLEQRVSDLERSSKAASAADAERRQKLENCVEVDADDAYWRYVHLNAKKGANDTWYGPQYMWESARKVKLDKIEECKLLYGK